MRIPSEFNDQSLYRRHSRRFSSAGSTRRLVRLVLGFALIVVVMNQAAKESFYEPFFGSPKVEMPLDMPSDVSMSVPMGSTIATPGGGHEDSAVSNSEREQIAAELDMVVDGSVWRGADFAAFYRSLHRSDSFEAARSTRVGVVPLLQQPDVFRGRTVRFEGKVARAESIEAKENDFEIKRYWQLWLRPIGGADRPLVAIVADVPASIAKITPDGALDDGPRVEVVGIFLKRLAYQSSAGADLAPVIVGRIDGRLMSSPLGGKLVESTNDDFPRRLALTALAACTIGIAIASIAMWRTSVMTRRSRELRSIGRPNRNDFLNQLDLDANRDGQS